MSESALARLIERSRAPADERCELCDAPLADEHRHLLDLDADELRCACRPCALLFERPAAALGHLRLVPQRRIRLAELDAEDEAPVGLAWYVVQADGTILVRYPGPAGATTGVVDDTTWAGLVACWPELGELVPSVEALLVNTARRNRERWIVPIEDCYRLVAVIRGHWKGLSGGQDVWPAVDTFFAELAGRASGNRRSNG
jgi:hypothetical protein